MNKSLPKVAVILPAHNEAEYIAGAIQSLKMQTYPNQLLDIIVVDNNSTDNTRDIAKSTNVTVLDQLEGPVGKVRNAGVNSTSAEILFFMDSDCLAPEDWIEKGVKFILDNPEHVGAGGLRLSQNPKFLEKYWLLTSSEGEMLPSELLGSCLIIPRNIFESVGRFDENITAGEDSALHQTLIRSGIRVDIKREFSVIHLGNAVTVKAFINRQIWHSENYFKNLKRSMRDLVFFTVCLFLLSIIGFLISFPTKQSILFLVLVLSCIGLRSAKRIYTSKNRAHLRNIVKIYILDTLYLSGRSIGLLKGLFIRLKGMISS